MEKRCALVDAGAGDIVVFRTLYNHSLRSMGADRGAAGGLAGLMASQVTFLEKGAQKKEKPKLSLYRTISRRRVASRPT